MASSDSLSLKSVVRSALAESGRNSQAENGPGTGRRKTNATIQFTLPPSSQKRNTNNAISNAVASSFHPRINQGRPRQTSFVQEQPDVVQRSYQRHKNSLIPCPKCGRSFFPHTIEYHKLNCKAGRLNDHPFLNETSPRTYPDILMGAIQSRNQAIYERSIRTRPLTAPLIRPAHRHLPRPS